MQKPSPGVLSRHLPDAATAASKWRRTRIKGQGAECAHRIDEKTARMLCADPGDRLDRIHDSGGGLAVDHRNVGGLRIVRKGTVECLRIDGRVLRRLEQREAASRHLADLSPCAARRSRLARMSAFPSLGTNVPSIASTTKVPLPCSGTHTWVPCPPEIATSRSRKCSNGKQCRQGSPTDCGGNR